MLSIPLISRGRVRRSKVFNISFLNRNSSSENRTKYFFFQGRVQSLSLGSFHSIFPSWTGIPPLRTELNLSASKGEFISSKRSIFPSRTGIPPLRTELISPSHPRESLSLASFHYFLLGQEFSSENKTKYICFQGRVQSLSLGSVHYIFPSWTGIPPLRTEINCSASKGEFSSNKCSIFPSLKGIPPLKPELNISAPTGEFVSKRCSIFPYRTGIPPQRTELNISALQRTTTENSKQIFLEKELRSHRPNFHIYLSVSDLYIPTIDLQEICGPILGIYKSLTET
jgi:hypothetical protein